MKYKYSLLGLAAGTALLFASGCSKQESPATPAADNATRAPAPAAGEKPPAVEAPKAASSQPAAPAKPDLGVTASAVTTTTVPVTASSAAAAVPATNSASVRPRKSVADKTTATTPLASAGVTNAASAMTAQGTSILQQLAATAGVTNPLPSLAATTTNKALAALGMTNQVASAGTNQVQVLLEQAKNLSANQKYQQALDTLTQLYATKLTPEQKQKADDLKAQIQTSITQKAAAEATSALGNFLGGKK